MLTGAQQHAADRFAKSLLALSDDALIDTYHQAAEDHRSAQTEGSDNLSKAYAQMLAAEKAMQARFPDYPTRYKMRYPWTLVPIAAPLPALVAAAGEHAGMRFPQRRLGLITRQASLF
jgi:hypothetical protein